ncbi:NHLM bacteriocin system ABC transporter, peptidase/ATP-binding protein [Streptomyces sp. 1222.5]|uniref:NHLP family bacteriocin export ABC transporter peptidase/permease/ATPase subunit n=1 Tax=unclassified Streptomyces TaxID=2593676 RepID=UPI00089889B6|nr:MULTISPECIES: NHLP family bacteriocin export ABC transporter peptidase/permease/ATPase subunit [unclassified Streptomyces]PKW09373.1 NHLM bacteriocin system ABC transporter peptidase/ATP-binding protein [Streptomyces sp. 5112.2]SEC36983.1 NHLM bacteriocin system ABC transporter, peptidase/ATP-binding protein [Streptomyces sp. 1222.5]SED54196.1 NHLM bacteriocin system ABC transporter, peptidase/ATP-binding protein [Streptomyces sp. 2231.1]
MSDTKSTTRAPSRRAARRSSRRTRRTAARTRRWARRRAHRVPTVLQMESVECGAASLAMILAHYGRHVPLEELRALCGVSRDGAKASSVMAAARSFGLVARGFQAETDLLLEKIRTGPVIIFWAFQHFMVVEGVTTRFGRTQVAVNDPAGGPRLMEWSEFDSGFTGIVLTFEPGPDFRPGGRRSSTAAALLDRRLPSGRALPLVLLASLLLVVPGIVGAAYSRVFVDRVLASDSPTAVLPLAVAMAVTALMVFVLTSVQQHYLLRMEIRTGLVASARFFRHLLRLPIEFFLQRRPAEVAKRVASNDTVAMILSRDVAATTINLALVVFYGTLMVRYDVLLGVLGLTTAGLNVAVLQLVARSRKDAVAALRADRGNLVGTTFATLSTIESVKATGAEPDAFTRWAGFLAKVTSAQQRLGRTTAVLTTLPPLLAVANIGVLLLVGGLRVVDGTLSVGLLVTFQTLLAALSRPVTQLTNLGTRLQDMNADLKRIHDVEKYPQARCFEPGRDETAADASTGRLDGELSLIDVTFGYGPLAAPVVTGLSLTLAPGSRTAIVGGSGSGKSTVGRLVTGLYEPRSGRILISGRPRDEVPRTVLAASMAYVDQDVALFAGTVRDNLTLWDGTVPDEVVLDALQDAAVFDEVMSRPGGLNARVWEQGGNFSGGQRQRLELARALAARPTLLVLDEATSALDPATERTVMDNLRRRGCACLIIAHRLSTVRDADEIIVLDRGTVAERGTHDELLAVGGLYARLFESSRAEERDTL